MNNEEFDRGLKYNYKVLDKMQLDSYIEQGISIFDIMEEIEEDVYYKRFDPDILEEIHGDILQGAIFNFIDHFDFMRYLEKRYGTKFLERIDYWVARTGRHDFNK